MMVPASVTFYNLAHFDAIAERLQGVTFEMMPALDLVKLYDNPRTLFYLDPPYHPDTRSKWATKAYRHEMTAADHETMLEQLNRCVGMVALAGYRCPLYDEALTRWARYDRRSRVNSNGHRTESLWLNPAAEWSLRHRGLPLFRSLFAADGCDPLPLGTDEEE
jgi:DNA adenine methylase